MDKDFKVVDLKQAPKKSNKMQQKQDGDYNIKIKCIKSK